MKLTHGLMAGPQPLMIEFGFHHRLESCVFCDCFVPLCRFACTDSGVVQIPTLLQPAVPKRHDSLGATSHYYYLNAASSAQSQPFPIQQPIPTSPSDRWSHDIINPTPPDFNHNYPGGNCQEKYATMLEHTLSLCCLFVTHDFSFFPKN